MSNLINKIDKYHQSKKGKVVFGTVELLAAYAMISRAFETGSLWQYGLFLLLFVGGVNNLARVVLASVKPHAKLKKR